MQRRELVAELEYFPLELARQRRDALATIRRKMAEAGYTDRAVKEALGVGYSFVISTGWQAIADRYFLDTENPVHALVRLFCLNLPERRGALTQLFDHEELALLEDLRLLESEGADTLRAPVALWPLGELFIATDHNFEPDAVALDDPNRVMDLGSDSCSLALMVRDAGVDSALDLCTGSGGVALLASQSCKRVIGVDVNPRAINFARFNALFNGVSNCRFVEGDLYEPIGRERFDLVTANPPYVPTPGADPLLYRDGGRSGERVLSHVLEGCLEHLTDSGACLVVTSLVEHAEPTYEEKVQQWLGVTEGVCCLLLQGPGHSPYEFALRHNQHEPDNEAFYRSLYEWLDHYEQERIERIHLGYILVTRESRDDLSIRRLPIPEFLRPETDFSNFLGNLRERLASLDSFAGDDRPAALNFDVDRTTVVVNEGLVGGMQLPYPLVKCLEKLSRDGVTHERLVSALAESGHEVEADELGELKAFLEYLVLMGYLTV